jgi:hypothetical protein
MTIRENQIWYLTSLDTLVITTNVNILSIEYFFISKNLKMKLTGVDFLGTFRDDFEYIGEL